jgi:hypothetical protein
VSLLCSLAAVLAFSVAHATPSRAYRYTEVATPLLEARVLSNQGAIAGTVLNSQTGAADGALYRKGKLVTFSFPGAARVLPHDTNTRGAVVGAAFDAGGAATGFVRTRTGKLSRYLYPGADSTALLAVNNHGTMLGFHETSDSGEFGYFFLARNRKTRPVSVRGQEHTNWTDLNNKGELLGFRLDDNTQQFYGVTVRRRSVKEFSIPTGGIPRSINDRGQVLVATPQGAFVRKPNGSVLPLDYTALPAWPDNMTVDGALLVRGRTFAPEAWDLNDRGQVLLLAQAEYARPGTLITLSRVFIASPNER